MASLVARLTLPSEAVVDLRVAYIVPVWVDGRVLCRRSKCNQCVSAPEFIPLHYNCYQIFRKNKNPWSKAQPIYFADAVDRAGLQRISKISGLSNICKLPPKLVEMIQDLSPHQLFWRSIFVIALSSKTPQLQPLLSNPLNKRPIYNSCIMKQFAFIIKHIKDISDIHMEFRGDFLRLCLSKNQSSLCIWNTSSPPSLSSCSFLDPAALRSRIYSQLYARALDRSRGITFFFASGQLFGVHIHQTENSCAINTYEHISIHRRQRIVWVYMPIAPTNKVLVLGSRKTDFRFNILIRMLLAGEITLGHLKNGAGKDVLLGSRTPITLIYGEPQELQPISIFGAYPSPNSDIPLFSVQDFEPDIAEAYFSWAPLSHIQSVNTFCDRDTRLCKGIIIHYRNGGSRALGQCHLNVDQSTMVIQPCVLCLQSTSYSTSLGRLRHGVRVEVTLDAAYQHSDSGWKCLPLGNGVLTFSFTEDSSYMSLREEPSMTA
ncbi:hypothetical protein GGR58DRAFT_513792 [Xylaria digitata]|nr:hypothetical protein GGR58DRAFT_513792 [Xylaria digitata]